MQVRILHGPYVGDKENTTQGRAASMGMDVSKHGARDVPGVRVDQEAGAAAADPGGTQAVPGLVTYPWVYSWGNNEKRKTLKGKLCRVISRAHVMRSVLIELEDGQREIVSERSLRKAPNDSSI